MKDFYLAAAKRGATVCTRDGLPARILCFDSNIASDEYATPIVAEVAMDGRMNIMCYTAKGGLDVEGQSKYDLMMSDDDYLEKLERGEYGKTDHIGDPTEKVGWDYWRRMYAGMALQGLVASDKWRMMEMGDRVFVCVQMADALVDELKNTKK